MIQKNDLFSIPFYKKSAFTGSYLGMRYKLAKEIRKDSDDTERTILKGYAFSGPFNFDNSPVESMYTEEFDFSDQGLSNACDWLNQTYEEHINEWKTTIF